MGADVVKSSEVFLSIPIAIGTPLRQAPKRCKTFKRKPMKKTIFYFILFLICQSGYTQSEIAEKFSKSDSAAVGQMLPRIELLSINNELINLHDLEGKYILINFWATWCRPCLESMPFFKTLIQEHKSDNIEFVFISTDTDKEKWRSYVLKNNLEGVQLFANGMQTKPISYFINRIIYDKDGKLSAILSGIPVYVLIDPQGKILKNDLQLMNKSEMKKYLKELI